ncbi:MAG: hypothetical protein ACE5FU_11815 [Nitrospinota bacterium]
MKLGGATALLGIAAYLVDKGNDIDPRFGTEFDDKLYILNYEEASSVARKFDRLHDMIPEGFDPPEHDDLLNVAMEVIPQFGVEGFVERLRYPKEVGLYNYRDADLHNHVLGQSNCNDYVIATYRFLNPYSDIYGDTGWVATLTHELAHIQQAGACFRPSRENVEQSAQIMTLEVLAGMVNGGYDKMLSPLVNELAGMAAGAALSTALREDKMDEYKRLRKSLAKDDATSFARFNKAMRYWEDDMPRLKKILSNYSERPLARVIYAIRENDNEIENLAIRPRQDKKPFLLDDLDYFLTNAEGMITEIVTNDRESIRVDE